MPLTAVFADLPGPPMETADKLHELTDTRVVASRTVIAGADGREDVADYGRTGEKFFRRFLHLKNGTPSHGTFERVFAKLDPDAFADRFGRWMAEACEAPGPAHVAIDGKSARRSARDSFTGCLHRATARAVENRLVLGQRPVPDGGHEITTAPGLLAALDPAGAVVALDAAGCQKATVEQIRRQGGDYVAYVTGSQKGLRGAVAGALDQAAEADLAACSTAADVGAGHGRNEERYVTVVQNPDGLPAGWEDAGAVALVRRERRVEGQKNESTARCYITSLRVGALEWAAARREEGTQLRGWGTEPSAE